MIFQGVIYTVLLVLLIFRLTNYGKIIFMVTVPSFFSFSTGKDADEDKLQATNDV